MRTHGFLTVAVVAPAVSLGDVRANLRHASEALAEAARKGADLAVLPELCLTGYSCADLFAQDLLLRASAEAAWELAAEAGRLGVAAVIGLPVALDGRLYNCAALLAGGMVAGIVPKTYLPNYGEFYEQRWFASGRVATATQVRLAGRDVPFGRDLLFAAGNLPACVIGLEVCEDLWAVEPPSGRLALAGATVLCNPSASNELLGKSGYRRDLVKQQSARCLAAYLYASAGPGESSTDIVYGGHGLIAENGSVLAETERFQFTGEPALATLDLGRLDAERRHNSSFFGAEGTLPCRRIEFTLPEKAAPAFVRRVDPRPFVPSHPAERDARCGEIFAIQSTGLARRLKHSGAKAAVIGISGGLDSTLALMVAEEACRRLGWPLERIVGVSLPGLGTTQRTRSNAMALMDLLKVTRLEIDITAATLGHFSDIGHPPGRHDVVFENTQARERTQILMDLANSKGGLVVGTGDLSEAALGWCTFNADHISMYHVNIGVPKTLVRHLVRWAAETRHDGEARRVLLDVVDTPVSPELLPPAADGTIAQKTEDTVGPYELHDFFLYHFVRGRASPSKIRFLALQAFAGSYPEAEIRRWLGVFLARFFSQQFKRSVMPDGPKVGSVALSPRGDWRMPSDMGSELWRSDLDGNP